MVLASILLPDGGFALAGITASYADGDKGGAVWRLDANGRLMSQQMVTGQNAGFLTAIDRFPDGRLLVSAITIAKDSTSDGAVAILPPYSTTAPTNTAGNAQSDCTKYLPRPSRRRASAR